MEDIKKRNWDDNPRGFFDAYFDINNNAVCFFMSPVSKTFSFYTWNDGEMMEEELTITGETIALFGQVAFDKLEFESRNFLQFMKKEVE